MFMRIRGVGALLASAVVLAQVSVSPAMASLPRPLPPREPAPAASIPTSPGPDGGLPWAWIVVVLLVVVLVLVSDAAASAMAGGRCREASMAVVSEDIVEPPDGILVDSSFEDLLVVTSRGGAQGR